MFRQRDEERSKQAAICDYRRRPILKLLVYGALDKDSPSAETCAITGFLLSDWYVIAFFPLRTVAVAPQ